MSDEPKPKPLHEVMLTVGEEASACVEAMIDGARKFFAEGGDVPSAVSCVTESGEPHVYPAHHRNDVEKQCVWAFVRFLRETHPVVVLISEIWQSSYQGKKGMDAKKLPRPSEDPNHTEAVLITLWAGKRTIWISAPITRHPNHLGEFMVKFDTDDEGCHVEGELAKGKPYRRKERYGQR